MTVFANVLGAVVARLQSAPAVSLRVHRARLKPIAEQHTDAVVVRIQSSLPERFAILNAPTDWDTTLEIECYARSAMLTPDLAVDALLGKVFDKLAADPSLGGLVMDLVPMALEYDFAGDAEQMACATLTLKVLHRTQNLTLE